MYYFGRSTTYYLVTLACSSNSIIMSDMTFETNSEWDLFSSLDDSDDTSRCLTTNTPGMVDFSSQSHSLSSRSLDDAQSGDKISNNPLQAPDSYLVEFIKAEDTFDDFDICTDPSTDTSDITFEELSNPPSSPTSSPQPPTPTTLAEHDQLHNLPYEIVHRPPYSYFLKVAEFRAWVKQHLQMMLEDVSLCHQLSFPLSLSLRNRHGERWTTSTFVNGPRGNRFRTPPYTFPDDSWAMAGVGTDVGCLLRVIEILIDTLEQNIITTKRYPTNWQHLESWKSVERDVRVSDNYRDIYYRDVKLFGNQKNVDSIVDLLAYTLLIPRSCLNVVSPFHQPPLSPFIPSATISSFICILLQIWREVAAGKGLISGNITFQMKDNNQPISGLTSMVSLPLHTLECTNDRIFWFLWCRI